MKRKLAGLRTAESNWYSGSCWTSSLRGIFEAVGCGGILCGVTHFAGEESWAEIMKGVARIRNTRATGLRNDDEGMRSPAGGSRMR
jgi:hypothetical protein